MNFKLVRFYLLCVAVYIAYAFCLNFIYLNLFTANKNDTIKVLAEGTATLNNNRLILTFRQIPQENLYLELEYLNPSKIDSPSLFINNNLVDKYKIRKKRVAQIDYFHIDYFHIPAHFINLGDNNLLIEFKDRYPSEITIKLINFLYKLPSNNLAILHSDKEEVEYFSSSSYFRIPIFLLMILSINTILSKIRKIKFMQSFFGTNIILLGLNAMFIIMLLINLLTPLNIKITLTYFIKLTIFYFYIIALFSLFHVLNTSRKRKLFFKKASSLDSYCIITKNRLLFYFFAILMLSFGFNLVELDTVSKMISVIGDIIIIIICLHFLKGSFEYFKKERIYNVSP